jgi:methionine aminotransferase
MNIHSKLPNVGTTIFTTMSQLAVEHNAINLGQGFPDFPMSESLRNNVTKAMTDGYNQYVHMNGLPLLRKRLAEKAAKLYNAAIDGDAEITITPGGTYAIYTAFTTILQPGDEVIVFEPAYDSYIPNIEVNGGVAVRIALQFPDYNIPWNKVREKLSNKTRAIIINSPHNPTGAVLSENDMKELQSIVDRTNIIIISDEVYEHIIFDDIKHQSVLKYPELYKRSVVCFSFGKTYHCTGWKLGYAIAPPALMKEFRKVHQFNCFTCNTPMQHALAEQLLNEDEYLNLGNFLQERRDHFRILMQSTPFTVIPSHGSYFECFSFDGLTNESDFDLAIRLTKEYGITTIPVSAFYSNGEDNKVLRFCFAKKKETLDKAVEKLIAFKI